MKRSLPPANLFRKAMKITLYQFVLVLMVTSLGFASPARTQNVLNRTLTLQVEGLELRDVLQQIERKADVRFVYSTKIQTRQKLSLQLNQQRLSSVLEAVLTPLSLDYELIENRILLKRSGSVTSSKASSEETYEKTAPQDRDITGTVSGENGIGLPGVSVVLKGTQRGSTTDADGKFRIAIPDKGGVLVFSFVGYITKEITVGNQSDLTVSLTTDDKTLNEVVVVGYGTVKKSDLTGSVAKVGEENIKATPIVALDRAMQGRAVGVQVVQNTASPGSAATIRIRGSGSVNAGNEPLYVIDGFPTTGLNSINTNDIESIEVLKDASATAIYGSRGSNGVILVTTKRGKAGKPVLSYEGYYGVQLVRKTIPLLNARQFAEFVNEARVNGGARPYFDGSNQDQPLPTALGEGTDWQNQIFSKAPIQNHQLGISGGSPSSRYAVSFGYYGQDGIISNSNFGRYSLRTNLDNDITTRLKVGVSFQGAYTNTQNARTDVDGSGGGGVISAALSYAPTFPVYTSTGTYYRNLGAINGYSVDNPLAIMNEITNKNFLIRLLANTFLDYKVAEGLTFRTSFGVDLQGFKANFYATRNAIVGANVGGIASVSSSQTVNWLNENTLNYTKQLAQKHSVNALIGYTFQAINSESVTANANTFTNDFALFNNLGAGSTLVVPGSGASAWRLISYIGRINYGYDERFLVTLTARRDGSSRFGPNNKFGFFPSGAFGWRIINEKWLKGQKNLTDAKLRVSYGLSGNQEIGEFRYLANIANQNTVLGNTLTSGAFTGGIANPDLSWEKNAQFDAGIDLGLFNNRLQLTADYYVKTTSDLLFNVGVPSSSGFSSTLKNIGSVQNKGFEFSLNTIPVDRGRFRWTSEFNIAFNKNNILKLDGRKEFTTGNDALLFGGSFNQILLREGSALGNFYGRVMDGIFQNQAEVDASAQKTAKPGDIRYRDINGDGVINDNDRDIIGNSNPDFFGGFNNTFSYNGFELNVFLQGNYGNEILNFGTFDLVNLTGGNNQSSKVLDRWTTTNPSQTIPRANAAGGSRILSSFQIEDGSYLRVKNISLGYNLPKVWLDKLTVNSIKVYLTAQNWFTLTKYSGYDPEVNRFGSSSLSQGIDYGGYPSAKTVLVGLNVKF